MKIKINNKLFFYTTGIIKLLMVIALILVIILMTYWMTSGKPNREVWLHLRILNFSIIIILLALSRFIDPSYFECIIQPNELKIRYFKPDRSNMLQFIFVLFYLGNLKEHIITRQSYNGYTLNIGKFGIRKYIILQIISQGKIYDSKPFDISFLGTRKYTELILTLERVKEKITLN